MPSKDTPFTCPQCGRTKAGRIITGVCKHCYEINRHGGRDAYLAQRKLEREANREQRLAYNVERKDERAAYNKAYRAAHREAENAQNKRRYHANLERSRAKGRADAARWHANHPEYSRSYYRAHVEERRRKSLAYHAKHRTRKLEQHRAYYAVNAPLLRAYSRDWRRANPEKADTQKRLYYARRHGARNGIAVRFADIWERDRGICQLCGRPVRRGKNEASLDHILPLIYGGTHEPRNLQLAHKVCNSRRQHRGPARLRLF